MDYSIELELEQLRRQKNAIEQEIRKHTSLTSIHDNVKLDVIKTKGPQCGKWTVYYKYRHIRWHCATRSNEPSEKWVPLFCCNTRKEAVEHLKDAICDLQDLYVELSEQYETEFCGPKPLTPEGEKEFAEIIRCQGCRNKECMGRGGQIVCGITGEQHAPDWYCGDGEREEEEDGQ